MNVSLVLAIEALRKIRDAKAPDGITHPDAWYEGYVRQAATDTLLILETLGTPELR